MKRLLSCIFVLFMVLSLMQIKPIAAETVIECTDENDILEALAKEEEETSISLGNDITLTNTLVIPEGKTFIIYLNEKTLHTPSREDDYDGIRVDGKLVLYDKLDKTLGNGLIEGTAKAGIDEMISMGRIVNVSPNGTFDFYSGKMRNGYHSYNGGCVNNDGTFNFYDNAQIYASKAAFCGGGVCNAGTMNMLGGYISGCDAHVGGGLYCYRYSKTNIEYGGITLCTCGETGAGVYCDDYAELNIVNDGTKAFEVNRGVAKYIAGGIAISPDCKVKMIGNIQITNNYAEKCAGIVNGAGADNLEIGGDLVVNNNSSAPGESDQNNIGIMSDSTIKIVEPLGTASKIGFHLDEFTTGYTVISSGASEEYITSGKLFADFDGDTLYHEDGKALLDLEKFTVSFETFGGTEIPDQQVERYRFASVPENPTKADYLFGSWMIKEDDGIYSDIDLESHHINKDLTVYARWNYPIIKGDKVEWPQKSNNGIEIVSDGPYEKCIGINFLFEFIAKEDIGKYADFLELKEAPDGKSSLTIKKEILDMMDMERHYVDILFEDNMRSETYFTIVKAKEYIVPDTSCR